MTIDFIVELQVMRRDPGVIGPWTVASTTELYRERVDMSAANVVTQITGIVGNYARLVREVPAQLLEILTPEISVRVNLNSESNG